MNSQVLWLQGRDGFANFHMQMARCSPDSARRYQNCDHWVTITGPSLAALGATYPGLNMDATTRAASFYDEVGGEETFTRLVRVFYQGVAADAELRRVYPSKSLGPAEEHLRLFLMQYWGGPRTYDELRGHPRLRMRHARFRIGEAERDAWLRHMRTALDEVGLDEAHDAQLWDYLVMAANSLVNRPTEPQGRDLGLRPA